MIRSRDPRDDKLSRQLGVRFRSSEVAELEELAQEEKRTVAGLIRKIVVIELERRSEQGPITG